MTDAFVLGGVRTPVGRYGGSLSHLRTDDLLGRTMAAACERTGVPLDLIEDIVAGCVNPAREGMGDIARWSALAAGFPDSAPAITVNRFCASPRRRIASSPPTSTPGPSRDTTIGYWTASAVPGTRPAVPDRCRPGPQRIWRRKHPSGPCRDHVVLAGRLLRPQSILRGSSWRGCRRRSR
ncbi:hypothetical protein [Rhodococcus sp. JVH1]|uniref:thiolase family protein n=1 Tax=Rhodococcus sp. JVH1 TaxID=745408 RepID=UPI0035253ABA